MPRFYRTCTGKLLNRKAPVGFLVPQAFLHDTSPASLLPFVWMGLAVGRITKALIKPDGCGTIMLKGVRDGKIR